MKNLPKFCGRTKLLSIATDIRDDNVNRSIIRMQEALTCPKAIRGTLMPDCCPVSDEFGALPVGGVVEVDNAIVPAFHSEDICCSVCVTFFRSEKKTSELMDTLVASTHFGRWGRSQTLDHEVLHDSVVDKNAFLKPIKPFLSGYMGTQGNGNHFAFLGKIEVTRNFSKSFVSTNHAYLSESFKPGTYHALVTHHGSRNPGARLFKRGVSAAIKSGTWGTSRNLSSVDYDTQVGRDYWEALQYIQRWTKANHEVIHDSFLKTIWAQQKNTLRIFNAHNFVWKEGHHFYHGKGATPAGLDESGAKRVGLIPLNMAAPILIVVGRSNDEFLSFAPHGAGRDLSRGSYRQSLADEAATIAQSTQGIDVRWFCGEPDVAETPGAYKDPAVVKAAIEKYDLADVIGEIHPLGSVMAGQAPRKESPPVPEIQPRMDADSGQCV